MNPPSPHTRTRTHAHLQDLDFSCTDATKECTVADYVSAAAVASGDRVELTLTLKNPVKYVNAKARFKSATEVEWTAKDGSVKSVSFGKCVIAVGGRPYLPPLSGGRAIPGFNDVAITSDDLFKRKVSERIMSERERDREKKARRARVLLLALARLIGVIYMIDSPHHLSLPTLLLFLPLKVEPGKVLVVGGGYIALECGGFLAGLGYDVTVTVRDVALRGMDRQSADKVVTMMQKFGVNVLFGVSPTNCAPVDPTSSSKLPTNVTFKRTAAKAAHDPSLAQQASGSLAHDASTATSAGGHFHSVAAAVAVPQRGEETDVGTVSPVNLNGAGEEDEFVMQFDTVLAAMGRYAITAALNLEAAGLTSSVDARSGQFLGEETEVANIYAIGDCVWKVRGTIVPELTPVAIKSGELLSRRLFKPNFATEMDYAMVPTVVFSPVEYGFIGMSEGGAIEAFGGDNVEVMLSEFESLEAGAAHRHICYHAASQVALTGYGRLASQGFVVPAVVAAALAQYRAATIDLAAFEAAVAASVESSAAWLTSKSEFARAVPNAARDFLRLEVCGGDDSMGAGCLAKLICNKAENHKVVGFHFVGPNAGEVTQGFSLAVKKGSTITDFTDLVGMHPTDAEVFTTLETTRRSGHDWVSAGGCGGGKCG